LKLANAAMHLTVDKDEKAIVDCTDKGNVRKKYHRCLETATFRFHEGIFRNMNEDVFNIHLQDGRQMFVNPA
jgi:hypothetical protein